MLLVKILESFVARLSSIAKHVPQLLAGKEEAAKVRQARQECTPSMSYAPRPRQSAPQPDMSTSATPSRHAVLYLQTVPEPEKELTDTRQLLQTLVIGMKTLLFSITHYGPRAQGAVPGELSPSLTPAALQLHQAQMPQTTWRCCLFRRTGSEVGVQGAAEGVPLFEVIQGA